MRLQRIDHEFVEFIPQKLQPGKLYVSVQYATSAHLCCCGCGYEVSNPFTPTDWALTFDGETVSLWPSIGNSSFPCQSHYWIENSRVLWEKQMTPGLTALSRSRDKAAKARRYARESPRHADQSNAADAPAADGASWVRRVWKRGS